MSSTVSSAARPAAILSPALDLLCVGGLSLLILVPLLASGTPSLSFLNLKWLIWGQAVVNYSHFMASYRIVYRDWSMVRKHLWATVWVPAIMLVLAAIALTNADQSQLLLIAFFAVSGSYLAWHYTGQAWGMMASYTALAGARFEPSERRLIRSGLRLLLAWHVLWFFRTSMRDPSAIEPLYVVAGLASVVALGLGVTGLVAFRRRTGAFPPARALVAWIAIFFWYGALARWGVPALLLVQLFHAIQYLEFPARVELNRANARTSGRAALQVSLWAGALVAVSAVVLQLVPGPAMSIVAHAVGASPTDAAPALVLYFINIHHYFTDGVIWKISNPDVRRDLFAHVPSPAPAKPVSAPAGALARAARRPKPARR